MDLPSGRSLLDVPEVTPGVPPPPAPVSSVRLNPLPELPLDESDVVVVGDVVNAQPFLTYSESILYTEYMVQLQDTIKIQTPIKDPLAVLRRGGKARLGDGRVIEYNIRGQGDPILVGQRYLFFLSYHQEADAYHVNKMWHVENGVIKAAYPAEKAAASRFQSENDGRLLSDVIYSLRARLRN
jgi:hypothetical protein